VRRFSTRRAKKTNLPKLVWMGTDRLISPLNAYALVEDIPNPKNF
jgi:hypothetical protein